MMILMAIRGEPVFESLYFSNKKGKKKKHQNCVFMINYVYQGVLQVLMPVLAMLTRVMLCICRWWTQHYQTMMPKVRGLILLMNLSNT